MRPVTRREFLRAALIGAAGLMSACGEDPTPALRAKARTLGAGLECSDIAMLQPAEAATRIDNQYRQHTDRDDQFCLGCLNYVPPPQDGSCGTCKTVRGPINPDGWCKQWTRAKS